MAETCPVCRDPLPPGPENLYDLGHRTYMRISGMVERGEVSWETLSPKQQREVDSALAMLQEAADQGHMNAQASCGNMYALGHGLPKDASLAFEYAEMAAQQGHAESQNSVGIYYRVGCGCEQDYERAAEWYEKAADQGHAIAQGALGNLYYHGKGVEKDDVQAAEWYEAAASQGHAGAQNELGILFKYGRGVEQSHERAVELFKQSTAKEGQHNLAVCYANGQGVEKDFNEARKNFARAARQGHKGAAASLKKIDEMLGITPRKSKSAKVPSSAFKKKPTVNAKDIRNAPCSCGSGKKYKKCCGNMRQSWF